MENASEPKDHDTYLRIVDVAKHLFGRVGFQKTTILDISRELLMTPCDVYRFFPSKAELQEAVGRRLLGEIEVAVDHIVKSSDPANEKLHFSIAAIENAHANRSLSEPKLHELVATAFKENWPVVREHVHKVDNWLTEIISQGSRDREFHIDGRERELNLVRGVYIRLCHPSLIVENAEEREATIHHMTNFCLAALA